MPIELFYPDNPYPTLDIREVSSLVGGRFSSFAEEQKALDEICRLVGDEKLAADSSRIGAYRRCLEKLHRGAAEQRLLTQSEQIELWNTLVELAELRAIFSVFSALPDRSVWKEHLKKLVAGTHPHTNQKESAAWNFQYEMYLAAVTKRGGYDVSLAEPDVVVDDGKRTVGIAAKRPHSLNNLRTNLKKGSEQIGRAGLQGLVALDVSLIVGKNRAVFSDGPEPWTTVKFLVDPFVNEHFATIERACRSAHCWGALVTLSMPTAQRLEGGYGNLRVGTRWTIVRLTHDSSASVWIDEFQRRCERGLFGPIESGA